MYNHVLYLSFWFVNLVVFYVASKLFPDYVVTGNFRFTALEASIYASFWLTFIVWMGWDFIFSRGIKYDTGTITWVYFWILNTLGIWLVARFAYTLGFGISNWVWAVTLGLIAVFLQKIARGFVVKRNFGGGIY